MSTFQQFLGGGGGGGEGPPQRLQNVHVVASKSVKRQQRY